MERLPGAVEALNRTVESFRAVVGRPNPRAAQGRDDPRPLAAQQPQQRVEPSPSPQLTIASLGRALVGGLEDRFGLFAVFSDLILTTNVLFQPRHDGTHDVENAQLMLGLRNHRFNGRRVAYPTIGNDQPRLVTQLTQLDQKEAAIIGTPRRQGHHYRRPPPGPAPACRRH